MVGLAFERMAGSARECPRQVERQSLCPSVGPDNAAGGPLPSTWENAIRRE
jgi:hypothetical protein